MNLNVFYNMKTQFTILAMFLAMTVASFAQYTINLKITNTDSESQDNLIIGVHPDATDYIDEEEPFNEYEHPGTARGNMLHFFFTVPDKHFEGASTNTYIDYRSEDIDKAFTIEYHLRGQFGADEITLSWNIPSNPRLDSAYMVDDLTGDLFEVDMLSQEEYTVTNTSWKRFKIVLVFKDPVSVEETEDTEELAVYPNPTSDYLKINMDNIQSYKIFDVTGQEIMHGDASTSQIDVSGLEKGFYNIVLIDYNAKMQSKKFIKL